MLQMKVYVPCIFDLKHLGRGYICLGQCEEGTEQVSDFLGHALTKITNQQGLDGNIL